MSRPLRIEFPGALYHLTTRGDRREDIYLSDDDRQQWLMLLGKVSKRFNWRCHAYCLMSNHYHIVVETVEGNLSKGMRHLNGVYTQYFNRTHDRVGHVFQGRYKAILVEKDSYLLELARYVVLNPVRAGIVKKPEKWHWSSYLAMIEKASTPEWLEKNWILGQFGVRRKRSLEKYQEFVYQGIDLPTIWEDLSGQIYLGSEKFIDSMKGLYGDLIELNEIPKVQHRTGKKPMEHFSSKYERGVAMYEAYHSGHYTMKQIAEYFGVHYATVSRAIKNYENTE